MGNIIHGEGIHLEDITNIVAKTNANIAVSRYCKKSHHH